jgi:hypothetical protein
VNGNIYLSYRKLFPLVISRLNVRCPAKPVSRGGCALSAFATLPAAS